MILPVLGAAMISKSSRFGIKIESINCFLVSLLVPLVARLGVLIIELNSNMFFVSVL